MQDTRSVNDHPLSAAVAAEEEQYEYEIEGAPWWMPINQNIEYQPGAAPGDAHNIPDLDNNVSIINPYDEDVAYMDSVKVLVNDNPWLNQMANEKFKESIDNEMDNDKLIEASSGKQHEKESKRKYLLSIDFQVNCRKFILFTSILFFIVAMTYAASIYTGFYHIKGIGFNAVVCVILIYGLITGFFCSYLNKYSTRTLLGLLNIYWIIAWSTVFGLMITAIVYLVLFPTKFRNHCRQHSYCEATTESIIFAECSLVCTLILYIFLAFFYMQRIAILRLIIANLRDYSIKYETSCFARIIHRHTYRYLKGWKSFRRIITKHTGLRMSDVLYCGCWFRKCSRKQSKKMETTTC